MVSLNSPATRTTSTVRHFTGRRLVTGKIPVVPDLVNG
jgi:hypothetical protein